LWFWCEKGKDNNVITFLYGGGVVEKVMAGGNFFLSFFLFFLWCFWFGSLELTINNEMVVLFFVEGWNG